MVQRSNMWYAYFRFYIDEDDIKIGLNTYCKEWENMFAVGYNYHEYKCFVDNLGGFEHWVGDMSGYISQTREVGFIDGSPSDNVYDTTLLMGKSKMTIPDLEYLHAIKPPLKFYVRKITASAAADATILANMATGVNMIHSFYGAYDETKIEVFNYTKEITTTNTGSPTASYTIDISKEYTPPTVCGESTVHDPANAIDQDWTSYASAVRDEDLYLYLDLGSIQDIYNICYKCTLQGSGGGAYVYLYYGDTIAGCNTLIESDLTSAAKTVIQTDYRDLALTGRFIGVRLKTLDAAGNYSRLYDILVS